MRIAMRSDAFKFQAAAAKARRAGQKKVARLILLQATGARILDESSARQFRSHLRANPGAAWCLGMNPNALVLP